MCLQEVRKDFARMSYDIEWGTRNISTEKLHPFKSSTAILCQQKAVVEFEEQFCKAEKLRCVLAVFVLA